MIKKVIRRLKKRMEEMKGYDDDSIPEKVKKATEIKPKGKKTKKEVFEELEETMVQKLEKELEKLKEMEAKEEKAEESKEEVQETNLPSVDSVLHNHEQRILAMEAKWFRLGGI